MQMHSAGFVMVSNRLSPEMMLEDGIESCNDCYCLAGRVAMECHQVWVDLQSSIVAFHSLRNESLLDKSAGHVVVGICESWLQPQRRLQLRT